MKIKKLHKIIPSMMLSTSHKGGWEFEVEPTLNDILHNNYTGVIYNKNTRGMGVRKILGNIIVDFDGGTKKDFKLFISKLEQKNISYLAVPTPSHKNKLKDDQYRMRIIIRVKNLNVESYKYQFLQMLGDIRWDMNTNNGLDGSCLEIDRFYYPPVMKGIKEPKQQNKLTGVWSIKNPKPRNVTTEYALKRVFYHLGKPYTAKYYFNPKEKAVLIPPLVRQKGKNYTTDDTGTDKELVTIPRDKIINTELGETTYEKLYKRCTSNKEKIRCDCPFDASEHSDDGVGADYAFCNEEGILVCAASDTHRDLLGVIENDSFFNSEVDKKVGKW